MNATAPRMAIAPSAVAVLLMVACGPDGGCAPPSTDAGSCPDLKFQDHVYDEWREVERPRFLQEVGNATYPACNAAESCDAVGGNLDGLGATDVWLVDGVDTTDAVIGLREGTHTYVIFVRVGVDPDDLRWRFEASTPT